MPKHNTKKKPPDIISKNRFSILNDECDDEFQNNEYRRKKAKTHELGMKSFFDRFNQNETNNSRFLIMKAVDETQTLRKMSPFIIEKTIKDYAPGEMNSIKRLQDGTILIQTNNKVQSDRLLKMKKLYDEKQTEVSVYEHPTLNSSKGIAFCDDFIFLEDDEIIDGLKSQGVVAVRRMKKKNAVGIWENTKGCILTFNKIHPPSNIKVGFYNVRIRLYVPNPMRCHNCHKFNHTASRCKFGPLTICGNCSEDNKDHQKETITINGKEINRSKCDKPSKCLNCHENHPAWSRDCPKFKQEYQIQKIKTEQRITFKNARLIYLSQNPQQPTTYANITKSKDSTTAIEKPKPTNNKQFQQPQTSQIQINKATTDNHDGKEDHEQLPTLSPIPQRILLNYSQQSMQMEQSDSDLSSV